VSLILYDRVESLKPLMGRLARLQAELAQPQSELARGRRHGRRGGDRFIDAAGRRAIGSNAASRYQSSFGARQRERPRV